MQAIEKSKAARFIAGHLLVRLSWRWMGNGRSTADAQHDPALELHEESAAARRSVSRLEGWFSFHRSSSPAFFLPFRSVCGCERSGNTRARRQNVRAVSSYLRFLAQPVPAELLESQIVCPLGC